MRTLAANIEDVFREAAARWTLVAYFVLSSLFILIFALAVNLDIVDGALAGARLFGQSVQMGGQRVDLDRLVIGFESGFSAFLYVVGTFLAIFATAHLTPRLQEKGTIDLYLSRPVARVRLLASRYVAGMMLAASNVVYLVGAIWLIVAWKTRVFHPRFFLAGLVILFAIAVLMAFSFCVGVLTSSTGVSIMTTYAIFFFSAIFAGHEKIEAAMAHEWQAAIVRALYWVLPKTAELGRAAIALVGGGRVPRAMAGSLTALPFTTTAAFGLACFALAAWLFQRKDF